MRTFDITVNSPTVQVCAPATLESGVASLSVTSNPGVIAYANVTSVTNSGSCTPISKNGPGPVVFSCQGFTSTPSTVDFSATSTFGENVPGTHCCTVCMHAPSGSYLGAWNKPQAVGWHHLPP